MTSDTDWWIRLARTSPAGAAWLYLRELSIRTDSTTSWRTTASCAYARPAIPKSK